MALEYEGNSPPYFTCAVRPPGLQAIRLELRQQPAATMYPEEWMWTVDPNELLRVLAVQVTKPSALAPA